MRTNLKKFVLKFAALSFVLHASVLPNTFVTSNAYASRITSCYTRQLSNSLVDTIPFPQTTEQAKALISRLEKSKYARNVKGMMARADSLTDMEREDLWAMANKLPMYHAEQTPKGQLAYRRITINTNKERRAKQMGGMDESPDPAPPFRIDPEDKRPAGMPAGVYQLSSGKNAFYFETMEHHQLKNKPGTPIQIVYQQQTKDGKWVTQRGGYAAPSSSNGWDGRPEFQPDGKGGFELVITQGAMELPVNFRGVAAGAPELPRVAKDNPTRSRHIFALHEYIPASKGKPAQLVVRDRGSILNMQPSGDGSWMNYVRLENTASSQAKESGSFIGKLLHTHGYGENYIPDAKDPRKMWMDDEGYVARIFDMVTAETKIQMPDGTFKYIPTETRAVAFRMDPKNPSKIVPEGVLLKNGKPANAPIFITHNHFPGTNTPIPATVRYAFDTRGKAVEKRILQKDGTVLVITKNVPQGEPAVLNEGFNPVPGAIQIGSKKYYLGTNSAGEYTSGQPLRGRKKYTKYGTYLWFRPESEGPLGPYQPVMTSNGKDLEDMTKDLTQMYGFSWGTGRAQAFKENIPQAKTVDGKSAEENAFNLVNEDGRWWLKAHAVDVHELADGVPRSGYADSPAQFRDGFRRHQLTIPISFVEKNGKPAIQIDDPKFAKDLEEWRARRAERARRTRQSKQAE